MMQISPVHAFESFLGMVDDIETNAYTALSGYQKDFEARCAGQNSKQMAGYARKQLEQLQVDEVLCALHQEAVEWMTESIGEGGLADDVPLVQRVAGQLRRVSSNEELRPAAVMLLADAVERAVSTSLQQDFLLRFLAGNAAHVQEYRISQLEKAFNQSRGELDLSDEEVGAAFSADYTLTQVALAVHYMIAEGLGIRSAEKTKLAAIAHMLSARKIPIKAGRENLENSHLKTTFTELWQKTPKAHLHNLRFILRFYRLLADEGSEGMERILTAIAEEIDRTQARLQEKER